MNLAREEMYFCENMKHNKKMKKIVKICLFVGLFIVFALVIFLGTYFLVNYLKYQNIPLNTDALTSPALNIEMFDNNSEKIEDENSFNGNYVTINKIPEKTKEAFISIEDKDFYKHNGLNKKRILKAVYNNLKSMSLKEGASTISQQLIKNTHLSNEKTFERKIKEMVLTKKLEKNFDKDKILECYLNLIYFGNNCYGIESAANYYFNKSTEELDLNESCLLAGMIKSPNKYSPILNPDNALKRRNLVLKEMEKDGKISANDLIQNSNKPISLNIHKESINKLNSYSQAVIDEATKILNLPAKQIAIGGFKIYTYEDSEKQANLIKALESTDFKNCDYAGIVIDNEKHAVSAYSGQSAYKILDAKRQVGSCIKPVLVYAPALNENVITPATEVLDEKVTIGEYSPNNVGNKYSGYISVQNAVKNSVNTVAIKVLSYIGIDTGKMYASRMGFHFDEKDDSYALALGGMTYGENLKTLTNSYTTFANDGKYADAKFISHITDKNGKLVYEHKPIERQVFREDTACLMTNILKETAKSGTARKLSDVKNTEVASKTGTVGKKNKNGNLDAYNISYTPEYAIGVWCGNLDNETMYISGGNEPTEAVKKFITSTKITDKNFKQSSQVTEAKIDLLEKEENHRIVLASPNTPERYTETILFSRFNMPEEISTNFITLQDLEATCKKENSNGTLTFDAKKQIKYDIYLNGEFYRTVKDKNSLQKITFPLKKEENEIKIVYSFLNFEDSPVKEKTFKLLNKNAWHKELEKQKHSDKWYI